MRRVAIVSMGPGDPALATARAREALEGADIVIGAKRLLESLPETVRGTRHGAVRAEDIARILREAHGWQRAALAMSGDAGLFSGAKRLVEELSDFEVEIIPGVSSAQLFAARLSRPWQDWRFESAHGIACDIETLARENARLFLVTGGENSVSALCARLAAAGMGDAQVSVGERLSYPDERITAGTAVELAHTAFDPLAVMLVERAEAAGNPPADPWPYATQGVPDELFARGSAPMTKQEVRAVALAKLGIAPADTVYDIGAGTGSVAVEAARLASAGAVFAIERHAEACALVRENAARFSCGNITIVEGLAPAALDGLPPADAAFIGGAGGSLAAILDALVAANPAVRVCVTAISLETVAQTTELLSQAPFTGFEACQIFAARSSSAGAYHLMKAENPIFILTARGGGAA